MPIFDPKNKTNVNGVLDVDSEFYNYFDEIDKEFLTKIEDDWCSDQSKSFKFKLN